MGGKSDDSTQLAQQQRADEQARQQRIREGTARIGQIFEGGALSGTDKLAAGAKYDPTKKYYTAGGGVWTPPPNPVTAGGAPGQTGGGSYQMQNKDGVNRRVWVPNTSAQVAAAQKTPEQLFTEALSRGEVFGGQAKSKGTFGPDYYADLRKSFIDYATPQLVDQYSDAKRQLIYALDRQGLLDSGTMATKGAALTKLYDTNKQDIVAQAGDYVKQQKNAVEDARQGLIQTLNATGDANAAASGALARAQALSAPPKYSPLTDLFQNFTAGLGQQAQLEQAGFYSGQPIARYNTGIFTPSTKSVKVS